MKKYSKPDWAVQQIERQNGLIEDICKHGVGHPNQEFLDTHPALDKKGFGIHGCDGCCSLKQFGKKIFEVCSFCGCELKEETPTLKQMTDGKECKGKHQAEVLIKDYNNKPTDKFCEDCFWK